MESKIERLAVVEGVNMLDSVTLAVSKGDAGVLAIEGDALVLAVSEADMHTQVNGNTCGHSYKARV